MRLDHYLVTKGYFKSRSRASDAIRRGTVKIDGSSITRPAFKAHEGCSITIDDPSQHYVSRAALKLKAGFDAFDIDTKGLVILDVGASTGGFSQLCVEYGASHVVGIDIGHNQLDPSLQDHPSLTYIEGLNARDLTADDLPLSPDALVMDVSFISIKLVLKACLQTIHRTERSFAIILIKPQFEAGRGRLGKGGIVSDQVRKSVITEVTEWIEREITDWKICGIAPSPITGGDGNQEYLIYLECK